MIQQLKNIFHFLSALLAVIYYGYPARRLKVIGVTGTDGKTTTCSIIFHLLNFSGKKAALITTVGGFIGNKEIDTGLHTTSPNPWVLQKMIKKITDQKIEFLVLESTSHGLDQHRLLGTNRMVGVITNISHEHLDYHKNLDRYLSAKARLFKGVKYAVLNSTDSSFEPLKKIINQLVITYSDKDVPKFVKTKFKESYNQLNAQAAIAVARIFNLDEELIDQAISTFPGVKGRVEEIKNSLGIRIFVDFAHTPNAIDNVLSSLKSQTQKRLITVFGATGRRDISKRPKMGKFASELSDFFIITTDDSYNENVQVIIHQIKSGVVKNHQNMMTTKNRMFAIQTAINMAKKGDTVAILGQGHEKSLNLDGYTETPWSDQEAVIKAIKNRKAK